MAGKPKKQRKKVPYCQTYLLRCEHCGTKIRGVEEIRENGAIRIHVECHNCGKSGRL